MGESLIKAMNKLRGEGRRQEVGGFVRFAGLRLVGYG